MNWIDWKLALSVALGVLIAFTVRGALALALRLLSAHDEQRGV